MRNTTSDVDLNNAFCYQFVCLHNIMEETAHGLWRSAGTRGYCPGRLAGGI